MAATAPRRRAGREMVEPDDDLMDPIAHLRRAKKAARDDAQWREVNSDDFADLVQAYAHEHNLDAQKVLDDAQDAAREGKRIDPELRAWIDSQGQPSDDDADDVGKPAAKTAKTAKTKARAASSGGVGSTTRWHAPGDGSSFLLGVLGYAIAINWIRYGPAGVRDWLAAKFLNRVSANYPVPPTISAAAQAGSQPAPQAPINAPGSPDLRSWSTYREQVPQQRGVS